MWRVAFPCALAVAICLLPTCAAVGPDFWEAADCHGAAYIRWALRRGVDPNHASKGW